MVRPLQAAFPALQDEVKRDLAESASDMLAQLRSHGVDGRGAVTRLVYSPEWQKAMAEVETWFTAFGLELEVDSVGSRFGRLNGEESEVVLTGSHIDSVVNGGAYDGVLGVVVATCAVGWLARAFGRPQRSIAVLANCEEESSRFGGNFWGARAMLGLIEPEESARLQDADGITIGEAMERCGLDPAGVTQAQRSDIAAFIETHIEQGPHLESSGVQIGIVERVVGVRQMDFRFEGVSGHAGTVPMELRRDPLAAAAELVGEARRTAVEAGDGAVATVGAISVRPGGSNQIAGDALLTVDFRHSDGTKLDDMESRLVESARAASDNHDVELSIQPRLSQRPVGFDRRLRDVIQRACEEARRSWMTLPSGAGHDAQLIARYLPAAMLFVPSKGGHSHRPDEETDLDDIVAGIEVLMRTLYRLCYEKQ